LDELFLGMQALNVDPVDEYLQEQEAQLLREYVETKRRPIPAALFVSASCRSTTICKSFEASPRAPPRDHSPRPSLCTSRAADLTARACGCRKLDSVSLRWLVAGSPGGHLLSVLAVSAFARVDRFALPVGCRERG